MASALVLSGVDPRRRRSPDAAFTPDFVLDGVAEILPRDRLEEVS